MPTRRDGTGAGGGREKRVAGGERPCLAKLDLGAGYLGGAGQVRAAVERLEGAEAWVVDLRGNRGGLVRGATEVAWVLLGRDALVAQVAAGHSQTRH